MAAPRLPWVFVQPRNEYPPDHWQYGVLGVTYFVAPREDGAWHWWGLGLADGSFRPKDGGNLAETADGCKLMVEEHLKRRLGPTIKALGYKPVKP